MREAGIVYDSTELSDLIIHNTVAKLTSNAGIIEV